MFKATLVFLTITLFACQNNALFTEGDGAIVNIPSDSSLWKIKGQDQYFFFPNDSLFMSLALVDQQIIKDDSIVSVDQGLAVNSFFEKDNDHYVRFGHHWNSNVKVCVLSTGDSSFVLTTTNSENGKKQEFEIETVVPLNSLPNSPLNIWQDEYSTLKRDTLLKYVNTGEEMIFTYFLGGKELSSFNVIPYHGDAKRLNSSNENDTLLINPIDQEIYYLNKSEVSNDKGVFKRIQSYNLRIRNYLDSTEMRRVTNKVEESE